MVEGPGHRVDLREPGGLDEHGRTQGSGDDNAWDEVWRVPTRSCPRLGRGSGPPNVFGTYLRKRCDAFAMSGVQRLGLLLASIAVAAAVVSVAIVVTRPPSRTISIDELRAGVAFVLGGVLIQDTGITENQNGHVADGGSI